MLKDPLNHSSIEYNRLLIEKSILPQRLFKEILVGRIQKMLSKYTLAPKELMVRLFAEDGVIVDRSSTCVLWAEPVGASQWPLSLALSKPNAKRFVTYLEQDHCYASIQTHYGAISESNDIFSLGNSAVGTSIVIVGCPSDDVGSTLDPYSLTSQQTMISGTYYEIRWPRLFAEHQVARVGSRSSTSDSLTGGYTSLAGCNFLIHKLPATILDGWKHAGWTSTSDISSREPVPKCRVGVNLF